MKLNLNFANRRYINRKVVSRAYWIIASVLILMLVWFVKESLLAQENLGKMESQLAALEQDEFELLGTKSVPLDSQRLEEIRQQFDRNQKLLDQDSFRWTELFDRIEVLLPQGVSIRGFSPDYEEKTLAIEGVAQNLTSLQELLDRLLESDSISNAYLNRHATIKVNDTKGNEYSALSFSVNLEGVF